VFAGSKIHLTRGQSRHAYRNSAHFTVNTEGNFIVVKSNPSGLVVKWDGKMGVHVYLSNAYRGKVCRFRCNSVWCFVWRLEARFGAKYITWVECKLGKAVHSALWYDVVMWSEAMQCDMLFAMRCDVVWCDVIQCNVIRRNMMSSLCDRCDAMWCDVMPDKIRCHVMPCD